jgi:integrase
MVEQDCNRQSRARSHRVGAELSHHQRLPHRRKSSTLERPSGNLLATINKSSRTKHYPSLPWHRMGAFMSALRVREGVSAQALEFAILTACRYGEVRGALWTEFDTAGKVWTIPSERMKAKREHEVPSSDAALVLLESMPKVSDIVFTGTKVQPLSDMSLTTVIRCMNGDGGPVWTDANGNRITVHGFRSSFRMWAAEGTNYPREVAEHALAHQCRCC